MLDRDRRDNQEEIEHHTHPNKTGSMVAEASGASTKDDDTSGVAPMTRVPQSNGAVGLAQRTGRWTPDEKILFLYGLRRFGKGRWKKMSIYLPHRSLVQIKSHAQKVLKRLESGENVFRRLEENYGVIDHLIVQAAKQRDLLSGSDLTKSLSASAKRKRTNKRPAATLKQPRQDLKQSAANYIHVNSNDADAGTAVIAAAALCQLSSLAC